MSQDVKLFNLVNPNGKLVGVPVDQVNAAMRNGYREETDEEYRSRWLRDTYGGTGGEIAAGAAGAARGLTFGLSDQLLTKANIVDPEVLRTLEQQNPASSTVGEIAGAVLPSVVSGGTSAAASGARAIGTLPRLAASAGKAVESKVSLGLAKRLGGLMAAPKDGILGVRGIGERIMRNAAAKAAGGATEGALYGAGQAISEDAIGDAETTAERVIAHVGMGALLGGAAGGVLGAASEAVPPAISATRKAASKAIPEGGSVQGWLEKVANESAVKATGARGVDIRRLGSNEKMQQVGRDLRQYSLDDGTRLITGKESPSELHEKLVLGKKETIAKLSEYREKVNNYVKSSPDDAYDYTEFFKRVRDEVLTPLRKSLVPQEHKKADKILKTLEPANTAWNNGKVFTPKELEKLRSDLADIAYPKSPKGGGIPPQPPSYAAELVKTERILADFLEQNAERVIKKFEPESVGKYAELKRQAESMIKGEKMGTKSSMQDLGNRWISPSDYMTGIGGGILAGGPTGILAGVTSALLHKAARERGRALVARIAGETADRLSGISEASSKTAQAVTDVVDSFVGATKSAANKITAAPVPASIFELPSRPSLVPSSASSGKRNDRVADSIKSIDEIKDLASDQAKLTEKISKSIEGISGEAPKTAAAIATTASKAVQFLASKAPSDKTPDTVVNPVARKWKPSVSEVAKWNRYVDAVSDPLKTLGRINDGTVSREEAEAIKVVYPKLYQHMQLELMGRISELEYELPYKKRVQMSILFDVPLDPTLQPAFIGGIQQLHQSLATQQQAAQQSRSPGVSANLSRSTATQSQRLAGE